MQRNILVEKQNLPKSAGATHYCQKIPRVPCTQALVGNVRKLRKVLVGQQNANYCYLTKGSWFLKGTIAKNYVHMYELG